jgi:chromosome segregation ATPase
LEDKNKLAQKSEDSLRFTDETIKSKEIIINEYKTKNEKLERKLMDCCREINKGNEIIENLKNDLHKKKENIKTKNEVIKMQESKISAMNEAIDKAKSEVTEIGRLIDSKDRDNSSLKRVIEDMEIKLKESERNNQDNQSSRPLLTK